MREPQEWGVLKTTAITWQGWNPLAHKVLPFSYWGQDHLTVKEDDVIVTKAGPRHRCGVVAHVTSIPANIIVSGKMIGLRPNKNLVVPKVLTAALAAAVVQKYLDLRTTGMAESQVNFTNDDLLGTPILLPPLPEQRRIAEILDTTDETIQQTERLIAKLKAVKAGLLHDLLTRGLDQHGRLRDPVAHPEQLKESPLGKIPSEWTTPQVGEIAIHVGSGATPRGGSEVYETEGVLFIRSQNVTFEGLSLDDVAFINQRTHLSMKRSEIFPHDVLLNITGASIGRCCPLPDGLGPANVNQHVCAIRLPAPTLADAYFLSSVLASYIGQHQIYRLNAGGNREGLNYQQLRSFFIPWPETAERARISHTLCTHEARIRTEEAALAKLRQVKRGLMDDLLTGRVRAQT